MAKDFDPREIPNFSYLVLKALPEVPDDPENDQFGWWFDWCKSEHPETFWDRRYKKLNKRKGGL